MQTLTILVRDSIDMHDALCHLDCFQSWNTLEGRGEVFAALDVRARDGVVNLRCASDGVFCAALGA